MRSFPACALAIALAIPALVLSNCAAPPAGPEPADLAGRESCGACHEQETRFQRYGAHRTVTCETCHGPGAAHAEADHDRRPRMELGDVELCLSCHREGAGRSDEVASTIVSFEGHLRDLEREHRVELDREKSGTDCVYCHDPHLLE